MITKKDVELSARVPECNKKINEIRLALAKRTMEEEEHRAKWSEEFYKIQGTIRAAETELVAAAEADARIYREVPLELRLALEAANVAVRGCGEAIGRARQEAMAARANYERRIELMKRPGSEALTKAQIEHFVDQITLKEGAHAEQEKIKKACEAKAAKIKDDIARQVAGIKKAAK